jgi:hypothetical protein
MRSSHPDRSTTMAPPGVRRPNDDPERTETTAAGSGTESESVQPAKLLRIGTMVKQLLEELRGTALDEASRARLREIQESSIHELAGAVSSDLAQELARMTSPFADPAPSESELRVAQAQLVGWLEGLFHGLQAAALVQEIEAHERRPHTIGAALTNGPSDDVPKAGPGNYL